MHGAKPPKFLLLHGAGGSRTKWRRLLMTDVGSQCVAIDLPAHGASPGPLVHHIVNYAEILASGLTEDVIVVGHSMGGLVGIELAAQSPFVHGLILVASHATLPVGQSVLTSLAAGTFPDGLFYASYAKSTDGSLLAEERDELNLNPITTVYADYACCNAYDGETTFSLIDIPIMSLYGEEDRLLPRGAAEQLRALNPNVRSHTIPGSGHYIMLEQPNELSKEMTSFRDYVGA